MELSLEASLHPKVMSLKLFLPLPALCQQNGMVSHHPSTPGPTWVVPTAMGGFLILGVWVKTTQLPNSCMTSTKRPQCSMTSLAALSPCPKMLTTSTWVIVSQVRDLYWGMVVVQHSIPTVQGSDRSCGDVSPNHFVAIHHYHTGILHDG